MPKHFRIFFIIIIVLSAILMPSSVFAADEQLFEEYQVNFNDTAEIQGANWSAQMFTVQGTPHSITRIRIRMYVESFPSPGLITASIRDVTSGGVPANIDLASGTLDANFLANNTEAWQDINLTDYQLEAWTQYALVLRANEGDDLNSLHWSMDTAGSTYGGGVRATSTTSGISWSTVAGSAHMFEIYGVPAITINSSQVFSSYREDDDWLVTLHYENIAAPYYPVGTAEQRFKIQLLKGENQLDNGSFEAGDPPADWNLSGAAATLTRDSTEKKIGLYSAALTRNGADANVTQSISSPSAFSNNSMSLGSWIKCDTAGRAYIRIADNDGGNVSTFHTGSGEWEWLSVTRVMPVSATSISAAGFVVTGDTTAYFDNMWLIQSNGIPVDNIVAESVPRTWGSKPGSVYLSSSEVAPLQWGSVDNHKYALRLWATYDSNAEATYELLNTDWQGADLNQLDNWCIRTAESMEEYYGETYIINISGQGESLNEAVGPFFDTGIPLLSYVRPNLFQTVVTEYSITETVHEIPDVSFTSRVGADVSTDMDTIGAIFNLSGEELAQYMLVALFVGLIAFLVTGNILGMVVIALPLIYIGVYTAAISITYLAVGIFLLAAALVWVVAWSRT